MFLPRAYTWANDGIGMDMLSSMSLSSRQFWGKQVLNVTPYTEGDKRGGFRLNIPLVTQYLLFPYAQYK